MAERIAIIIWLLFNGTAVLLGLAGGAAGVASIFWPTSDALYVGVVAYLCALVAYLIGKMLCWVLVG